MFKPTLIFCLLIVYVSAYGCGRRHEEWPQHDLHESREDVEVGNWQGFNHNKPLKYALNQIGRDGSDRSAENNYGGSSNNNDQRGRNYDNVDEWNNNFDVRSGEKQRGSNERYQLSRSYDANVRFPEGRGGYDRGHNKRYWYL